MIIHSKWNSSYVVPTYGVYVITNCALVSMHIPANTGREILKLGWKFTMPMLRNVTASVHIFSVNNSEKIRKYLLQPVMSEGTTSLFMWLLSLSFFRATFNSLQHSLHIEKSDKITQYYAECPHFRAHGIFSEFFFVFSPFSVKFCKWCASWEWASRLRVKMIVIFS